MRALYVSIGVILLCLGLTVFLNFSHKDTLPLVYSTPGHLNYDANQQQFLHFIEAHGGQAGYTAFAKAIESLTPQERHTLAHAFGAALYATEGTSSLTVCDSRFSYGCFHEFLGQAIGDLGLGVVTELNQRCFDVLVKNGLSCQHGIGHGVLAHLGYTKDALNQALSVCRTLPFSDPIGGCYGGVFMEYNLMTMRNAHTIRPLEHNEYFVPCATLAEEYKIACYFWQPQWWRQVLEPSVGKNMSDMYTRIGLLCGKVEKRYRRNCFEGIGTNVSPDADFDPAKVKMLCEAASQNRLEQLYCKSYGANSLTTGGSGKEVDGIRVCEGLEGDYKIFCDAYARNEANILQSRDIPQ